MRLFRCFENLENSTKILFSASKKCLVKQILMTSKRVVDRINNVISNLSSSIGIVDFNYKKTVFLGMPTKDCILQFLDFSESLFLHHKNNLNS